jgi:predicted DNA-binding protein
MSFRIDRTLAGKLRGAAKHTGLTASQIIHDAVALHIARLEKKAKKPFAVVSPRKYGN